MTTPADDGIRAAREDSRRAKAAEKAAPKPKCSYCGASCTVHYCPNCGKRHPVKGKETT